MRRALLALAAATTALAACAAVLDFDDFDTSAVRPSAGEGGSDAEVAPFAIQVSPTPVHATTGVPTTVHVTIVRRTPFDSPILFTVSGGNGLTVQPHAALAPDAVDVDILAGDRHGAQEVALSATTAAFPSFTATAPLTVDVRGAPGSLDTSFGKDGVVVTSLRGAPGDLAPIANGRFVGLFFPTFDQPISGLSLVRFESDGSVDPTFGVGGVVNYGGGGTGIQGAGRALLVALPDSRIVVAWRVGNDVLVARLLASGAADPSFPDGGLMVPTDYVAALDRFDGGLIVSTSRTTRRLLEDGGLDPTYGDAGVASTGSASEASGATTFADGSLVVMPWFNGDPTIKAYRVDATGNVQAPLALLPSCSTQTGQLRRSDGRWYLLLGCNFQPRPGSSVVARFELDGGASAAFGPPHGEGRPPGTIVLVDGGVIHAGASGGLAAAITEYLDDGGTAWSTSLAGKLDGLSVGGVLVDGDRLVLYGAFGTSSTLALARFWL